MEDYRICYECDGKMRKSVVEKKFIFCGKDVVLKGIEAYVCKSCGTIMYSSKEAHIINKLGRAIKGVDISCR